MILLKKTKKDRETGLLTLVDNQIIAVLRSIEMELFSVSQAAFIELEKKGYLPGRKIVFIQVASC